MILTLTLTRWSSTLDGQSAEQAAAEAAAETEAAAEAAAAAAAAAATVAGGNDGGGGGGGGGRGGSGDSGGYGLFAHQRRSVAWMAAVEARGAAAKVRVRPLAFAGRRFGQSYEVRLPLGGVLA